MRKPFSTGSCSHLVVIVAVLPFEFDGFRHKVLVNLVVDVGFVGLAKLIATWNAVHLPVLDEMSTCLVKAEGNIFRYTLLAEGKYPVVVAWPGIES